MKLILASQSPRRKELLRDAGFTFDIHPALDKEVFDPRLSMDEALKKVACHKADEIFDLYTECCVLSADTIVLYDHRRLGKPKDQKQARTFLTMLSGRSHLVKTGVCIRTAQTRLCFVDTTEVHFRDLSDLEIEAYIRKGTCMDKAGAYGIQECDFVDWIDGDFFNVVGLPIEHVVQCLHKLK